MLRKFAGTVWGATSPVLLTTALALSNSASEFCATTGSGKEASRKMSRRADKMAGDTPF